MDAMLLLFLKNYNMKSHLIIRKSCGIANSSVMIDNKIDFSNTEDLNIQNFLKQVYKHYGVKYMKFYKMDKLTKLGFISGEVLLKDVELSEKYPEDRVGIVLANASSSIDIDKSFQETIEDKSNYFPSPALFVYTLPNIMAGEIAIKNKFKGEDIVFIKKEFPFEFIYDYVYSLFENHKLDACICGWVEANAEDYKSFLYLVERKNMQDDSAINYPEFTVKNMVK